MRLLQAARLGSHFAERNARSIVNENWRLRQLIHGPDNFVHIVAPQRTSAHLVRVHTRFRTQQAQEQGLTRHFQRKHTYNFLIFDSCVLRNVHGKCGFAHRWPRRDDHQIGTLQAAGHFIQIRIVSRQSGDPLTALQQGVNRAKRLFDNFLHTHEAAPDTFLGKLKNGSFGVIKDFLRGISLLAGTHYSGIGCMNQSPQQRFVANDLDVMLNAGPVGNSVHQTGDITNVSDRLQFFAAIQLFHQRNHVDWPRRLGQIDHTCVDTPMRIEREIFRSKMFRGLVVSKVIQQDRP